MIEFFSLIVRRGMCIEGEDEDGKIMNRVRRKIFELKREVKVIDI